MLNFCLLPVIYGLDYNLVSVWLLVMHTYFPFAGHTLLALCACSGEGHMKTDVDAVHKRICQLLAVVRTPSQAPAFVSVMKAAELEEQRRNERLVGHKRVDVLLSTSLLDQATRERYNDNGT